ncbi:Unknown protein sequence [Pseudomonas amygdali pv. myricae]|nr:Unknown protein sequence [Pseudomonas amygdali pv. myricae]
MTQAKNVEKSSAHVIERELNATVFSHVFVLPNKRRTA